MGMGWGHLRCNTEKMYRACDLCMMPTYGIYKCWSYPKGIRWGTPCQKSRWSPMWSALNSCWNYHFFIFVRFTLIHFILLLLRSCLPSSPPRLGRSARWAAPRRRRWPPGGTWRSPPWLGPGQPHPNFSWEKRKVGSGWGYSGSRVVILFRILPVPEWGLMITRNESEATHHFMRNMSSPVESVAPMILSGSRARAKPLSFSVWTRIQSKSIYACYVRRHITAQETQMLQQTSNNMALSD